LIWTILDSEGRIVAQGALGQVEVPELESREIGQISWQCDQPSNYRLLAEFGSATNEWPLNVFRALTDAEREQWKSLDDALSEPNADHATFMTGVGTLPMPFWREAAYEFVGDAWGLAERWERFLPISPDRALDPALLPDHEVIINRIDTRTYAEHPIAVRTKDGIMTTLRPFGGLGIQPVGITRNPSAVDLLRQIAAESARS